MTNRLAIAVCVGAILCSAVAGCEGDRPVVRVPSVPDEEDAGARPRTGGQGGRSAAGGGSGGTSPSDAGTSPPSEPTIDGVGCDIRSTGAVHGMVPSGNGFSALLTQLSLNGQAHDKCGAFSMGRLIAWRPMLRRSDGAVFYLLDGYLYRYVADELTQVDAGVIVAGGKSPFDNDTKLELPGHKCPPSQRADYGPFGRYVFKPNGGLVYTCYADPNEPIYNQKHDLIGQSGWLIAVDNEDKVLLNTPAGSDTTRFTYILFSGVRKSLKIVGGVPF